MRRALFFLAIIAVAAVSYGQSDIDYYDSLCRSACIDNGFSEDAAAMCNDMGYESQVEVPTDACVGAFWNGYPVEKCFCGTPTAAAGQTQIPEDLAEPEEPQQQNTFPEPTFTPDKCGTHNDIAQCWYDEACKNIGDCCSGFDYDKYCRNIAEIPPETAASSEVGWTGYYSEDFSEISTSAEKECPTTKDEDKCKEISSALGGSKCFFVPQTLGAWKIQIGSIIWYPLGGEKLTHTVTTPGDCMACPPEGGRCDYANKITAPDYIKQGICVKNDMCGHSCQWVLGKCVPADSGKSCKAPFVGPGTCRNIDNCNAATHGKSSQCLEGEVCCSKA